jgi:4-hydroxy-2-oxoheptanedioate aldolase
MADPTDLRGRLTAGETLVGAWCSLPGAATASLVAGLPGLDYLVTDLQHGASAETELPGICAAATARGVVPLVRVRSSAFADVGRPLDLGAHGVFVPNVGGAAHVAEVLGQARYAPGGTRSYGPAMPVPADPLRFIVLETRQAWQELGDILELDLLDGVYVGPVDLAYSLGHGDDPHDSHMAAVIAEIVRACVERGVPVGVHTGTGPAARRYRDAGARLVNAVADTVALAEAGRAYIDLVRSAGDERAADVDARECAR